MFPTKRRIFARQEDASVLREPLVISIDLSNMQLSQRAEENNRGLGPAIWGLSLGKKVGCRLQGRDAVPLTMNRVVRHGIRFSPEQRLRNRTIIERPNRPR